MGFSLGSVRNPTTSGISPDGLCMSIFLGNMSNYLREVLGKFKVRPREKKTLRKASSQRNRGDYGRDWSQVLFVSGQDVVAEVLRVSFRISFRISFRLSFRVSYSGVRESS